MPELSDKGRGGSNGFFLFCEGVPVSDVCTQVASFFHVNILVSDEVRNKEIYGNISGVTLIQVLDSVSWLLGVEYVYRDGIYWLGSSTKTILILPSSGLDSTIETLFKDVNIKKLGDKLVITGTERDISKLRSVYDQLIERKFAIFRLYAIEVSYDSTIDLGLDIDKSISYAFSIDNLVNASYNPIQALALSLKASLVASSGLVEVSSLTDTDLGVFSGNTVNFQVGQDTDRQMYSQSQYSQVQVVSSYNTQHTGLLIDISPSYNPALKCWYVSFKIENSEAKTDLVKTLTTLNTFSSLSGSAPVQVLAKLNAGKFTKQYSKGIPFLCDIPYLGRLFRISNEIKMNRQIVFVLQLKAVLSPEITQPMNEDNTLNSLQHKIQKMF